MLTVKIEHTPKNDRENTTITHVTHHVFVANSTFYEITYRNQENIEEVLLVRTDQIEQIHVFPQPET